MSVAWVLMEDYTALESPRLMDVFDTEGGKVRLRSRAIALDYLRRSIPKSEATETLTSTLMALRRSVNEVTIRAGSSSAEIMKALLRARFLHRELGAGAANRLIERLEDTYGWDGGYWEQRAIDARLRQQWRQAESFAAKAAAMLDDDHRNTTLGSVLMERAAHDATLTASEAFEVLERGLGAFDRAVLQRATNPVPILNCLSGLTTFVQTQGLHLPDAAMVRMQGWWATWFQRGRQLKAFAIGPLERELDQAWRQWEETMASVLEGRGARH